MERPPSGTSPPILNRYSSDAQDRNQRLDDAELVECLARSGSAVVLGVGLVMAAGAARASDDDEDDKTFEEKVIEGS